MNNQTASAAEKTILIFIEFKRAPGSDDINEFRELAKSAGANVVADLTVLRDVPDPKYFIGHGKVAEIKSLIALYEAELILFNQTLSPAQERNLERELKCRVLNRQGLILDVFAKRARTFEGKLQVELALLQHLATRLVRGWTHLERQKGGIGLRGPGETQLETDRRLLRERIKLITQRLERVKQQRHISRRTRQRAAVPTIALVGYTNAGKSTVFNCLTSSETYVADQLFATLDPTLRRIKLPLNGDAILADTVGFIRNLPHELVEAFSATLEETRDADLLLHVTDIHDPEHGLYMQQVNDVLTQIGAQHIPQLQVFNKIDLLEDVPPRIEFNADNQPSAVWISATNNLGIDLLIKAINQLLYGEPIRRQIYLTHADGALRSQLYSLGAVEQESVDEEGNYLLHIKLSIADFNRLFGEDKKNDLDT